MTTPAELMQSLLALPQDQLKLIFALLQQMLATGVQPAPPPAPAPPPQPKTVKMVSKAGKDLNGASATVEEVHGAQVIFSGPAGLRVYSETWADGVPRSQGVSGLISGVIPPSGVLAIGGSGTNLGPGLSASPMKCRSRWYYAPYQSAEYEFVGEISWTEHHSENLDWERAQANLTWDPYITPALTDNGWKSTQLKTYYGRPILPFEFDAIRAAYTTPGTPMPKDPYAMYAPGAPVG